LGFPSLSFIYKSIVFLLFGSSDNSSSPSSSRVNRKFGHEVSCFTQTVAVRVLLQ